MTSTTLEPAALVTLPRATDLEPWLTESLSRVYGTQTLNTGIKALMSDAAALVAGGHLDPHVSRNTGLRAFASEAGGCARAISLRMAGLMPDDITPELQTTFLIGDMLHDKLQQALLEKYPDSFLSEHSWLKDHISGRADGIYHLPSYKTVLEIKSCSKSSFQYSLWKGPQAKHILQAALSALVFDADTLHLVYIAKEPVKKPKSLQDRLDLPEYLSIFDWELRLDLLTAETERERLTQVARDLAAGTIGDTETAFEYIDDPDLFKAPCSWCRVKPLCKSLGTGTQPLSKVLELYPGHVLPDMTLAVDRP